MRESFILALNISDGSSMCPATFPFISKTEALKKLPVFVGFETAILLAPRSLGEVGDGVFTATLTLTAFLAITFFAITFFTFLMVFDLLAGIFYLNFLFLFFLFNFFSWFIRVQRHKLFI